VIKASNLNKGNIVDINGQPHQVKEIEVHTPSARGANTLYKVRFNNIITGQKLDGAYKGADAFEEMELQRRPVNYLYQDGPLHVFMDTDNYEQYMISEDAIADKLAWLTDGMEGVTALLLNGRAVTIDLPAAVDLAIVETAPVVKGASATNRNKPAKLENGVTVLAPEYLTPGEIVRVNTETGKFMSRAKS
jgi:elongation factor P